MDTLNRVSGPVEPIWEMETYEQRHLCSLPDIVQLWRTSPLDEDKAVYYLNQERGVDGQRAMTHSQVLVNIERIAVRAEHVVAVDLDRQTAQVMLHAAI